MPELPEVETMVRGLRPALEGRVLRTIRVVDSHLLQGCTAGILGRRGRGASVALVSRRGKWVVVTLDASRGIIVIQPRMTGGFWLVTPDRPDHVRLKFEIAGNGGTVWYCDARRLGKIALFDDADSAALAFERSLGPDALEIGRDDLARRLARTSRAIKPTLMDQKVLAGIGNIYADEILFRSRLHPLRPALGLSESEVSRLHAAIQPVLSEAIAAEGSSFDAGYRTVLGLEGGFLATNTMYGRGGQPCPACGASIVKAYVAGLIGRPTHFCAACQPGPPVAAAEPRGRRGPSGRSRGDRVD